MNPLAEDGTVENTSPPKLSVPSKTPTRTTPPWGSVTSCPGSWVPSPPPSSPKRALNR